MSHSLKIEDLHVQIEDKKILNGISLTINSNETHAIMGPNGSGKSTLCKVLMGHPSCTITKGNIFFDNKEINDLEPNERATLGLFLGFQQPQEIPGVNVANFLRIAKNINLKAQEQKEISPKDFMKIIQTETANLKIDREFISRSLNEGFSGGERKRTEILQMAVLEPKIAILDEIDSGLDIDALKIVAQAINDTAKKTACGMLLITHYQRILNYISPEFVHIMSEGKIIKSGNKELAHQLEAEGYEKFL